MTVSPTCCLNVIAARSRLAVLSRQAKRQADHAEKLNHYPRHVLLAVHVVSIVRRVKSSYAEARLKEIAATLRRRPLVVDQWTTKPKSPK